MKLGPEVVQASGMQTRLCHLYVSGCREVFCIFLWLAAVKMMDSALGRPDVQMIVRGMSLLRRSLA